MENRHLKLLGCTKKPVAHVLSGLNSAYYVYDFTLQYYKLLACMANN